MKNFEFLTINSQLQEYFRTTLHQRDTYYKTNQGRFKIREEDLQC